MSIDTLQYLSITSSNSSINKTIDKTYKTNLRLPWMSEFSQRYQASINIANNSIYATWQCCGFGHRFQYHAKRYNAIIENGKALLIVWPTRKTNCYSNIIGNNYTIHDLFAQLFDFERINDKYNSTVNIGDIFALDPSYTPMFNPFDPSMRSLILHNVIEKVIRRRLINQQQVNLNLHIQPWNIDIVENKITKYFYLKMAEHINKNVRNIIESFAEEKQLFSKNTGLITIHVRQGNNETGNFEEKHRGNTIFDLAYALNQEINYLTNQTNQKQWKIFIASDNAEIIHVMRNICAYEVIYRKTVRPKTGVWFGQWNHDTPDNCLYASIDALVDMMLLSFGDILLVPVYSSFNYLPQMVVAERDRIICGIFRIDDMKQWKCRAHDKYMLSENELNTFLHKL